jgi:hypothetical protein
MVLRNSPRRGITRWRTASSASRFSVRQIPAERRAFWEKALFPSKGRRRKAQADSSHSGWRGGDRASETAELPAEISTEDPLTDSAGDVLLWANNTLYGFNANMNRVLTATPEVRTAPQLLFGPGGTLYAVYGPADGMKTVSALIPAFTLSAASPDTITSPTHMQVTGVAAKRADGAVWKLKTCGSVILGTGFEVQNGAELKVTVGVSKCKGG